MTPQEYRGYSKGRATSIIAARVLELGGKKAFTPKPTQDFFRLRSFFARQDQMKLNVLFDYLYTIKSSNSGLSELFTKAEQYRQDQQVSNDKSRQYDNITLKKVLEL